MLRRHISQQENPSEDSAKASIKCVEKSHDKQILTKVETLKDKIITFSQLYLAWFKIASILDLNKERC